MSNEVKDQEMNKLKGFIESRDYESAYQWIESQETHDHLKSYHKAYVLFNEGKLAEARSILEGLKVNGLYSKEVNAGIKQIKDKLELKYIEQEYSKADKFTLTSASLPHLFYPMLSALLGVLFLTLLIKNKKLISVIVLFLSLIPAGIYYRVNSFQVEINLEEVTIYRGPSKIFESLQVLPIGTRFIVTKEVKDWKYIEFPSIFQGWVHKNKAIKQ